MRFLLLLLLSSAALAQSRIVLPSSPGWQPDGGPIGTLLLRLPDGGLTTALASDDAHLEVNAHSDSVVSSGNSTTTPLAGGATFTGSTIDMTDYATIRVSVYSDKASATNGFKIQFSNDGINWDFVRQTTLAAAQGAYPAFNRVARYARVVYTNGAQAQGVFRLQTLLIPQSAEFSRVFTDETPGDSVSSVVTSSMIYGLSSAGGGTYVQVKVDPSGALNTSTTGTVTAVQGVSRDGGTNWPVENREPAEVSVSCNLAAEEAHCDLAVQPWMRSIRVRAEGSTTACGLLTPTTWPTGSAYEYTRFLPLIRPDGVLTDPGTTNWVDMDEEYEVVWAGTDQQVRVNCYSYTSGSVDVTITGSPRPRSFTLVKTLEPLSVTGTVGITGRVFTQPSSNNIAADNAGGCTSVSTSSTSVLASQSGRVHASVCADVDNTKKVYINLGNTATTSHFPLAPGQCMSPDNGGAVYDGVIYAIAASGTQSVCAWSLYSISGGGP